MAGSLHCQFCLLIVALAMMVAIIVDFDCDVRSGFIVDFQFVIFWVGCRLIKESRAVGHDGG